jgi:oxygen-dependent protoporphyrinogen oxidase
LVQNDADTPDLQMIETVLPESARPSGASPAPPSRVVVVGGGIAGLAAAHALTRPADPPRVTLLERDPRFGGKILTERVDDFIIEGGPDSFLAAKPRGVGLAGELGLGPQLHGPTPRRHRAFVLSRNRLHPLPEGLSGLVPTRLGPLVRGGLLSLPGKARLAGDLVLPARAASEDESLASFVRRRLGRDAYDRLIEPLMAGIYAGDGERLSLAATFPQLRSAELAHGSLIRGVLASRPAATPPRPDRPAFLTPAGGVAGLVNALVACLATAGVELRPNTAALAIRRARGAVDAGYEVELSTGERLAADAVILATPAYAGGALLRELDPALAGELLGIPHGSTVIVNLAYRRSQVAHPLDGHGYVIPRVEGRPALAATWVSQKWEGRAPAGYALLRVFLGRFGQDELLGRSDAELIALARAELGETIGAGGEPALARVQRWPWGMPQYVLGHLDRLERIESGVRRHPGLAVAGNAYRGVGLPDVIASGEAAAAAILTHLQARAGAERAGAGRSVPAPPR